MDKPFVTMHGRFRASKRIGIPRKSVDRNAEAALACGLTHDECNGALRRYLAALYNRYGGAAGNIRVYGNFVYVFNGVILITVLNLPTEYRKAAVAQMKKKEHKNERPNDSGL